MSKRRMALPILLVALSGCAALVYEIVWFQLLQLVIGSSAVSLGLLLAAYMGGLCLGSAMFARYVPRAAHPMRVYGYLELGIGMFGLVALFGIPALGHIAGPASGTAGLVWRGFIAALCLAPPTVLMGASFPAISRWVEPGPDHSSQLGLLYSANVAGAVVGCLGAGFYLLRVYDMGAATIAAAAINAAAALIAFLLARVPVKPGVETRLDAADTSVRATTFIYFAIGISGLTALGAEVVWTRLLSLLLGATVYTFSIILAVFLMGLWAGSAAGARLAARTADPKFALAVCQGLLAISIAFAAYTIAVSLPRWPVDPWVAGSPWNSFDLDLMRCLRTILPATLLWGASFPLALAAVARRGQDPGRLAGEVYAANTAGSIVGALGFTLLAVPVMGTRGSQQLLIWLAAVGALAALGYLLMNRKVAAFMGATAVVLVGAWGLSMTVSEIPWQVIAFGRRTAPNMREMELLPSARATPLFTGEGMNASIAIAERAGQRSFYISGKSEASTTSLDMRLQRMMGHLPALFHAGPHSVLVVGFGAGVTAGSFVLYPEVQSIAICELEKLIPPASNEYFGPQNYRVLDDPRVHVIYDDARHYISTAREKFDVITTDPIHPWVKGTSTLYSKEYYELVRERLNPGGVVAQWLPVYESDADSVKTELATFFSVFPNATVWSNYQDGDGYDLVLLGRLDDSPLEIDALERRLLQPSYAKVTASLADVGFHNTLDLLATYAGRAGDLGGLLAGAQINQDLNLRLQYLAGLGLDSMSAASTYQQVLSYRRFPDGFLAGSPEKLKPLRVRFGRRRRIF
jgi:spermidine synthase